METMIDDQLEETIKRLQEVQADEGKRARENAVALTHMETALLWLRKPRS